MIPGGQEQENLVSFPGPHRTLLWCLAEMSCISVSCSSGHKYRTQTDLYSTSSFFFFKGQNGGKVYSTQSKINISSSR